jgi:hypothetical protein
MAVSTEKRFEVRYTITVDRPELRDASFAPVEPGKKLPQTAYFATQGEAVRFFNTLIAGEGDYSSEHVTSAQVLQKVPGKAARNIRKWTTRARTESESMRKLRTLAVGAKRRGALHTAIYDRDAALGMGEYYNRKRSAAQLDRDIEDATGVKVSR